MMQTVKSQLDRHWIPLYIHRLKGSDAWDLPDFLFGQYMRLLVELADSSRPGYLPSDPSRLMGYAGAKMKDQDSGPAEWEVARWVERCWVHLAAYFKSTEDRAWIYNERMLSVLNREAPQRRESLSLSPGFHAKERNVATGVSENNGDTLFERFRAAHPRATGSQAEMTAFMEACEKTAAEFVILRAQLYREAYESGEMEHAPSRADNWLRLRIYNEDPALWRKRNGTGSKADQQHDIIRRIANGVDG